MEPLSFRGSAPFTLGVEIEFQLLDRQSLNLAPRGPALLDKVPDHLTGRIKPEFIQSMVEVNTRVCLDMAEIARDLESLCRLVERLAAESGCVIFAASLHPFALLKERQLSPGVRYGEIMADLQLAGRRMISQALHVHVGLPDAATAIRVCDSIRPYLPILLALTTSSPFLEGEDTGFHSYRTNLFKALPRSGIPETLESWKNFQDLISLLNEATILSGIKELWWDVRPHPDFGTVEIRICDLPSRFDEILAVTALIQALVAKLALEGHPGGPGPHREIILNNKWHASRYGLAGTCIAQRRGRHMTFARAAADLLELAGGQADRLGGAGFLPPLARIIAEGTSAHRQRAIHAQTHDLLAVIEELRGEFWQ